MASDEIRKKWGTIFMGEKEASVEQLAAMQAPIKKEREKKEQAEDYMERVKARAADRAREILGAAYTERQNVLQEAKNEAQALKRHAADECARLKSEAEKAVRQAAAELRKAEQERELAEKIREQARQKGLQEGMDKAGEELHEFRAELGQTLASVLTAIERQCKNIVDTWSEELVTLTQVVAQAGTGFILQKEHESILRNLVFQALDLLENRSMVTVRVNPADEAQVSDMFRAARDRAPELKQWIVTGDANIEPGGLVAESGTGSVDLQRQNFRELVSGILVHLGLPDRADSGEAAAMRELVEKEVAHIASLTPELDLPETAQEPVEEKAIEVGQEAGFSTGPSNDGVEPVEAEIADDLPAYPESAEMAPLEQEGEVPYPEPEPVRNKESASPTLEELEEELFPVEESSEDVTPDPNARQEGGFL